MTLNKLIAMVGSGEMTVSQAVDVVERENMTYAIKYFSPIAKSELPYWDMYEEWKSRQVAKVTPVLVTDLVTETTAPAKTGQLWEPCERCGSEPCYMPLNLCSDCWPN